MNAGPNAIRRCEAPLPDPCCHGSVRWIESGGVVVPCGTAPAPSPSRFGFVFAPLKAQQVNV